METSLKTDFAKFSLAAPKNVSWPKFGGAEAPLALPARTPMAAINRLRREGCLLWRNRHSGVRQVERRIYSMIKGSVFETGVKTASTQGCYQWTI